MHSISTKSFKIALRLIKEGYYDAVTDIPSITIKLVSTDIDNNYQITLQLGLN